MLKIVAIIGVILLLVWLFIIFLQFKACNKKLIEYFDKTSVIVYGCKGSGKDLLFQKVIYLKRKEKYMSNNNYGYKYLQEPIKELSTYPNTFEAFINGTIKKIQKNDEWEDVDYYISDVGIYMPSQYNGLLNKNYPTLPVFYAISRHLYNNNIHINSQYLTRAWNLLREQADKFIHVLKTHKIGKWLIVDIIFYDRIQSASQNILPMRKPGLREMFNKYYRAQYEQFVSTYGEIIKSRFLIKTKHIKYDSRHFHKLLFGETAEEWKKRTKYKGNN